MPKHVEPEYDPFDGVGAAQSATAENASTSQPGKRKAGEPTQREMARLKKKQAVLAKIQEQEQARTSAGGDDFDLVAEREAKRAKDEASGTGI